jgi:hypothetical protein
MALRKLLATFLAFSIIHAWPQLPTDDDDFGSLATLPVIPYTATQNRVSPRGLPVVDDDLSVITLPVTSPPLRGAVASRQLPTDEDGTGSFLTLPIIHSTKPGVFRRAVEIQLANRSDVAYYAQLFIGNPPQPVYAQLDTGSFELWVNPDCSVLGASDMRFCQAVGFYDTTKSTTATRLSGTRTLRYGIGAANISYVKDDISVGPCKSDFPHQGGFQPRDHN